MPNELISELRAEEAKELRTTVRMDVLNGTADVLAIASERACCV